MDSGGIIQWQKCLGGTFGDGALSVQQTADGGFIVAGWAGSMDGDVTGLYGNRDYWIVKLNSSGNIQWQKCLGGTGEDWLTSAEQTADGGYIVAGYTSCTDGDVTGNHGGEDFWVVKLSPYVGIEEESNKVTYNIFPNPATSELIIENGELKIENIEIYSSVGEKVFEKRPTSNVQHLTISVADFLPGIYFITVTNQAGNKVTKKVVKM